MKSKHLAAIALAVASALGTASSAHAVALIEPGIGWHFGSNDSDGFNGLGFDLRGAVLFGPLAVGLAGHAAWIKDPDASDSIDANNLLALGAYVGFLPPDAPISLRAQFDFLVDDESGVIENTGTTGTNLRFGVGFRPVPKLAVNLDYIIRYITSTYIGDTDIEIPDAAQPEAHSFFLSLSVPVEF